MTRAQDEGGRAASLGALGAVSAPLGALLFRYRAELAVPFLLAAIAAGRPSGWSFVAGLAVAALGEWLRIAALRHIGPKSRRTGSTGSGAARALVRSGPYAWTRNPLYLGNIAIAAGVLVALGRPLLLVGGLALVALHYRVIVRFEERTLEAEHGEAYRRYRAEVPRLLPRPPRGSPVHRLDLHPYLDILLPEFSTIVTFEIAFALAGALAILKH